MWPAASVLLTSMINDIKLSIADLKSSKADLKYLIVNITSSKYGPDNINKKKKHFLKVHVKFITVY